MKIVRAVPELPTRRPDSHKNDFGHLAVVAGSRGMTGAASLTSLAALRTGAGLVTLAIPESLNAIVATKLTEVMTRPLAETPDGTLAGGALAGVTELLGGADVLAIGPGLSRNRQTAALALKVIASCPLPMVMDADALNALAEGRAASKVRFGHRAVLTPHPGEFARLSRFPRERIAADRRGTAASYAGEHEAVVVLKGHRTVVTDGTRVYVNRTGNAGMATAGSGDVLTGMIGGCLAQGMEPFEAAVAAVWLHGLAGDIAAGSVGEHSLIASDVLGAIPTAILRHLSKSRK